MQALRLGSVPCHTSRRLGHRHGDKLYHDCIESWNPSDEKPFGPAEGDDG